MSKVLKRVDINTEMPYTLKSPLVEIRNKSDNVKQSITMSALNRFYEDSAKAMVNDAVARAGEIINGAKAEADKIISGAIDKKDEIEKQAYEKGYREGFEKGRDESLQQNRIIFEESLRQFDEFRKQLIDQNAVFLDYLEREALKIALQVAEKILLKQIEVDFDSYMKMIKSTLEKAGAAKTLYIRIAEDDYEKAIVSIDTMNGKNTGSKINFIKDPTLSKGECIIYSDYFEIDAGIHTQVENIRSKLKESGVLEDDV